MRWQIKHRMDFIHRLLGEKGRLNRSDLMKEYAISSPQASMDIQRFMRLYPGVIEYDKRKKTYVAAKATKKKAKHK
jgi:hypothetical protein